MTLRWCAAGMLACDTSSAASTPTSITCYKTRQSRLHRRILINVQQVASRRDRTLARHTLLNKYTIKSLPIAAIRAPAHDRSPIVCSLRSCLDCAG
jgi:hypothetical protein